MSFLHIQSVSKRFGTVQVLQNINLEIGQGEFFTLLGPSGCGKTTLLRVLAGFLNPDNGSVFLSGRRLDQLPAHQRDIGMVFQDYAIFPHLSVAENIAFGLKARTLSQSAIDTRVAEAMHMVQLNGMGERLPSALSGGQQQRVGLARAIAIRPQLLLMDEPLSNLDAKLRTELRDEIRDLQKRLGITTVYVTHDQEEALAVSDRICVMNKGQAEQIDNPFTIYTQPHTRFAASFVGTMNFITCNISANRLEISDQSLAMPDKLNAKCDDGVIELAIRPEQVELLEADQANGQGLVLQGKVEKIIYLGRETHIKLTHGRQSLVVQVQGKTQKGLAKIGQRLSVLLPANQLLICKSDGKVQPLVSA